MEMNQIKREGGLSQERAQHEQRLGGEKQHGENGRRGGYSQHSGMSRQVEKIGRRHIPNSHVYSSKELGLPKEKKVGTGVDLNITMILGFIPCPFSYPCNRNLLSACSLQDTVLGRWGLKMITAQSLPQGIRCTMMPEGLSLANACASAVVRALPAKGLSLYKANFKGVCQELALIGWPF